MTSTRRPVKISEFNIDVLDTSFSYVVITSVEKSFSTVKFSIEKKDGACVNKTRHYPWVYDLIIYYYY